MICPKCRTATLASLVPYSAEPPCRCSTCGGHWVRLESAAQLAEHGPADDAAESSTSPAPLDQKAGLCPEGHGLLSRTRVELDGHFFLERCPTCSGVWLDRGEWERLASARLLDDLGELWTRSWQRKQFREQQENIALQLAEQRFGGELLGQLLQLSDLLRDHPQRGPALAFLLEHSQHRS